MIPKDPIDPKSAWMGDGELKTAHDLVEELESLQLLADRLDLKIVSAIIGSAIGMVPLSKH